MKNFLEVFITIIGIIGVVVLICILFAFPFMWLWNWLMPVIFGLTKITIWQSVGLMFLSSMIFKSPQINKKQ